MSEQRKSRRQAKWFKLDNAATIYPASLSRKWAAIFRISAELDEPVDPLILRQAMEVTLPRFPSFTLRLRNGLFWNYMEEIRKIPDPEPDVANPCVRMNLFNGDGFMFRIRYYHTRIALEIFHVLSDGTGALTFLRTLVAEYLRLRYGSVIPRGPEILDCTEPPRAAELEDSFARYARPETMSRREAASYHLHGTPADPHFINITTGIIPAEAVRVKAKEIGVSVTEYLAAALIMAVYNQQSKEVSRRLRRKPLKISVPVNLRRYYDSTTLRNFSSFINPGINPAYGTYTFEEAAIRIKHQMGLETAEKMINARMSRNVSDAGHALMRVVPLFLKTPTLKIAHWVNGDRVSSMTISNLGVVKLPEEMARHVTRLNLQLGAPCFNPISCGAVTYNGTLYINFTRTIREADIERHFFTFLVRQGIPVKIESNRRDD